MKGREGRKKGNRILEKWILKVTRRENWKELKSIMEVCVTDNEFESEPSDQRKLLVVEKNDQVVTWKGVGYRSRFSHIFGILGILNKITLNYEISLWIFVILGILLIKIWYTRYVKYFSFFPRLFFTLLNFMFSDWLIRVN